MKPLIAILLTAAAAAQINPTGQPARRPKAAAPKPVDPLKTPEVKRVVSAAPAPDYRMGLKLPAPAGLPQLAPTALTLPNGLRVFLLPLPAQPLVEAQLVIKAGQVWDPPERPALSALAIRTLVEGGTTAHPGSAFRSGIEAAGGRLTAEAGPTHTVVAVAGLSTLARALLSSLRDLATSPAFDPAAMDLVMGAARASIGARYASVRSAMDAHAGAVAFGPRSPFGARLTYDAIHRTGPEDLVAFHKAYVAPANAVLAVSGDFDPATVSSEVTALFQGWTGGKPAPAPPSVDQPQSGAMISVAPMLDAPGTLVFMAGGAASRGEPAEGHQRILAAIFGGAQSPLARQLRANPNWRANAAAQWMGPHGVRGQIRIEAVADSGYSGTVIKALLAEAARLAKGEFSADEITTAKALVATRLAASVDAPGPAMVEFAIAALHGASWSAPAVHQAVLDATQADLAKAAQAWQPTNLAILVSGNTAASILQLDELGRKVEEVDRTIPPPTPPAPCKDPAVLAAGGAVLDRLRQAMGGLDRIRAVTDFEMTAEGRLLEGNTWLPYKQLDQWRSAAYRREQASGKSRAIFYYDGKLAWVGDPARRAVGPMPPLMAGMIRGERFRNLLRLATPGAEADFTACSSHPDTVEITAAGGLGARLVLDPATHLPRRLSYMMTRRQDSLVYVEESFEDWKETSGVRLPSRIITKENGRKSLELTVTSIKINAGLTAAAIEKKP